MLRPPLLLTLKVSSGIPCSRTSRAALGGWPYPYFDSSSSVVIKPCLRMCSMTILGRLFVTAFSASTNFAGSFCFFLIRPLRKSVVLAAQEADLFELNSQARRPTKEIDKWTRKFVRFARARLIELIFQHR